MKIYITICIHINIYDFFVQKIMLYIKLNIQNILFSFYVYLLFLYLKSWWSPISLIYNFLEDKKYKMEEVIKKNYKQHYKIKYLCNSNITSHKCRFVFLCNNSRKILFNSNLWRTAFPCMEYSIIFLRIRIKRPS